MLERHLLATESGGDALPRACPPAAGPRPQWDPDQAAAGAASGRAPLLSSPLTAAESIFVFYSTHIFLPPRAMIQSILQREEREGYSGRFFLYTQWVLVPRFPTQSSLQRNQLGATHPQDSGLRGQRRDVNHRLELPRAW